MGFSVAVFLQIPVYLPVYSVGFFLSFSIIRHLPYVKESRGCVLCRVGKIFAAVNRAVACIFP